MPGARDDSQQNASDAGDLFRPNARHLLNRKQLLAKLGVFQFLGVGLLLAKTGRFLLRIKCGLFVFATVRGLRNERLDAGRSIKLAVAATDQHTLLRKLVDAPCRQPQKQGEFGRLQLHHRKETPN